MTYLANPFRMLCEEKLQGVQLLGNTLDVIQSIYADNDFDTTKTVLHLCNAGFDRFLCKILYWMDRISDRMRTADRGKHTWMNESGSIPIGNVPTCAKRPSNSTPLGIVGRLRIRVHEERKCRA